MKHSAELWRMISSRQRAYGMSLKRCRTSEEQLGFSDGCLRERGPRPRYWEEIGLYAVLHVSTCFSHWQSYMCCHCLTSQPQISKHPEPLAAAVSSLSRNPRPLETHVSMEEQPRLTWRLGSSSCLRQCYSLAGWQSPLCSESRLASSRSSLAPLGLQECRRGKLSSGLR